MMTTVAGARQAAGVFHKRQLMDWDFIILSAYRDWYEKSKINIKKHLLSSSCGGKNKLYTLNQLAFS